MKKEKDNVYDFRKVMMEVTFGEFKEVDLSKVLGNTIHQNTGDIGMDDIARTIYREGKAEIPDAYKQQIVMLMNVSEINMVVAAKRAVIELLTK